jgi:hypothetical protein
VSLELGDVTQTVEIGLAVVAHVESGHQPPFASVEPLRNGDREFETAWSRTDSTA